MADILKQPPVYRNIHISQVLQYRLPLAALVSILHRISGALLFVLLPFTIWLFDTSLTSEVSYAQFTSVFANGVGGVPGWFFKLIALALIWAYLQHFIAGLRHLWMDTTNEVGKKFGRQSALVVLVLTAVLTVALGLKLFF